jgi:hypothetical protein
MTAITREDLNPQPQRSTEFWSVLKKHLALLSEHYRQPISELSVIVYAEDLQVLTPTELDAACIEARKTSVFLPVSAEILKAHTFLKSKGRVEEYLGPPLLDYPGICQEEREAALEFSRELKEKLLIHAVQQKTAEKKRYIPPPLARSLEEQKAELRRRGLLK